MAEQSLDGGRQAPGVFFYDMAQDQENRPMRCRCRKIAIRQKSAGHRAIYVPLGRSLKGLYISLEKDVNSSEHLNHPKTFPQSLVTVFQVWPPTFFFSVCCFDPMKPPILSGRVGVTSQSRTGGTTCLKDHEKLPTR